LARADQVTSRLRNEYVRWVVKHMGKPPTRIAKAAAHGRQRARDHQRLGPAAPAATDRAAA
jgi:hypothetical protein